MAASSDRSAGERGNERWRHQRRRGRTMINTAVADPERIARGLVQLAQSHRQLCADFLRDHRDGMDTPAVAKFAARIRMFDRVIASASLALSNLPDDNNDRHAMLRATIDSMAADTTADLMPQPDPSRG